MTRWSPRTPPAWMTCRAARESEPPAYGGRHSYWRRGLRIEPLRGNVDSRLRRFDAGELDAIVLACAGLIRLGLESRIAARINSKVCLPAVAQGVIGIECRGSDQRVLQLLSVLARLCPPAGRQLPITHRGACQTRGRHLAARWLGGGARRLETAARQPIGQCRPSCRSRSVAGRAYSGRRRGPAAGAATRRLI